MSIEKLEKFLKPYFDVFGQGREHTTGTTYAPISPNAVEVTVCFNSLPEAAAFLHSAGAVTLCKH